MWVDAPIDLGSLEHPEVPGRANLLRSRILAVPEFRAAYCDRLAEYMDTIFSDAVLLPQVDALYGAIEQDGLRDWRKNGWEQSAMLKASPDEIKTFIRARKEFLTGEMASFCPAH
jgi:spore coat protein CotH